MAARTTRKGNVTTIDLTGPFFQHDPALTFRGNVKRMMDALAAEGEADVKAQIGSFTMPRSTGWTQSHVIGYTRSTKNGSDWKVSAAVNVPVVTLGLPKKQAIARNAARHSIEDRFHPFRKTKNRLAKSRKVNVAELLKGLT